MATDVIMPQMGFDMREGKLLRWLKREGEEVHRGEAIAEIETDKATVEVEAFAGGVLAKTYIGEGTTVPVGEVIGIITAPGEAAPERPAPGRDGGPAAAAPAAPPPSQAQTTAAAPAPETGTAPLPPGATVAPQAPPAAAPRREGRVAVSPVARKVAEDAGIPLEEVEANVRGSGPNGRITKEDVESYAAQRKAAPAREAPAPAAAPAPARAAAPPQPEVPQGIGIVVPQGLSPMRQAIARRMSLSKILAPHFYVTVQVDMGRAMALRQELNAELTEAERISVNDMVVKAAALALKKHPHFNVAVLAEGLKPYPNISIGIAVALPDGLVAPGLPDTGSKTLREIAVGTRDLVERARNGRLRAHEVAGGSFSVSNMGMYDIQTFTAIITPPNAAAVSIGSVKPTPVVRGDQIAIAQIMSITLSSDHRAVDGAQSAVFVNEIKRLLEKPTALLL